MFWVVGGEKESGRTEVAGTCIWRLRRGEESSLEGHV